MDSFFNTTMGILMNFDGAHTTYIKGRRQYLNPKVQTAFAILGHYLST
ncbi:hypothetical protein [Lysinibacillus telephonicus]